MTDMEVLQKVMSICGEVLDGMDDDNIVVPFNDGDGLDVDSFYPEKMSLAEYWLVVNELKADGLLATVLRMELDRLGRAVDEAPLFNKLLSLIVMTLYAVDTPDAVDAGDQCFGYIEISG